MKISNRHTENVAVLPKIEDKYINRAKKSELKVLYYIFSHEKTDVASICLALEETQESVSAALAYWRAAGVVEDDEEEQDIPGEAPSLFDKEKTERQTAAKRQPASYTLAEITSSRAKDSTFGSLVSYLEKLTGRLYNAAEQGIILYLYDTLGINYEVIMGVAKYCVSMGKTSVRYIEKTVQNISEEGVTTYAELETYLGAKKKSADYEQKIKNIIGASDRAFSKSEKEHIEKWEKVYGASEELVSLAYEKTVSKINRPQISYMSKILESWYDKGLKTPEEVEEYFKNTSDRKKKPTGGDGRLDFDLDEIFEKPSAD